VLGEPGEVEPGEVEPGEVEPGDVFEPGELFEPGGELVGPGGVVELGSFGLGDVPGLFGSVGCDGSGCNVGSCVPGWVGSIVGSLGGTGSGVADSGVGAGAGSLLAGVVSASSCDPPQPKSGATVRARVMAMAFFMEFA